MLYEVITKVKEQGQRTYRSIKMNEKEIEFSGGFTDLHTETYTQVLQGKGFPLMEAKPAIETVYTIRNSTPIGLKGEYHEMCNRIKST